MTWSNVIARPCRSRESPRPRCPSGRPRGWPWPGSLCQVVHLLKPVDGRLEADGARLELQREVERIVARLVQVAAVEPQRLLPGRLPHVALLALPRPGVLLGVRAEAPDLAHAVGHLLGDEVGG